MAGFNVSGADEKAQGGGSDLATDVGLGASTSYTGANADAYNSIANSFGADSGYNLALGQKAGQYGAPQASNPNAMNSQAALANSQSQIGMAANGVNQALNQNNAAQSLAMNQAQNGSALAQNQLQAGTDQGIAAQMALANSSTGGATQRAGALRNAQATGAQAQAQQAAQAGALQAQTQQAGINEAGSLAGQTGSLYNTQGGLYANQGGLAQNQYALESGNANTQAALDANVQNQNNQTQLGYGQLANQDASGQLSSLTGYNSAQTAADQIGASEANANAQTSGGLFSGVLGLAGGALGLSDERAKEDIREGDDMADDFLRHIDPKGYRYKANAPGATPGQMLGFMAQDVEKTPGVVKQGADGYKRVDMWPTLSASVAGLGRLNERLEKLEGKRNART